MEWIGRTSNEERIERLRDSEYHCFRQSIYEERKHIYARTFREFAQSPQVIKAARALMAFLSAKEIVVNTDELLLGHAQFCDYAGSRPADVETEIKEAMETASTEEKSILREFLTGFQIGLYGRASGGHVIAGYEFVLESGLDGLKNAAVAVMEDDGLSDGSQKRIMAESFLLVYEAASCYIERYARAAENAGLEELAVVCRKIAHDVPESFTEAIQLLWFVHEIVIMEQLSGSFSIGRLDRILYPYYRKDLAEGRLTEEEAYDLIRALWIKFGGVRKGYQNVTVGGCDEKGTSCVNDLTYFALFASGSIKMDQPLLSLRWTQDMPADLKRHAVTLLQMGMGFPALFNDRVCIEARRNSGIDEADARNYGIVGCVELSTPGKERADTEGLRINWAKIIELMLHRGRCAQTGKTIGISQNRPLQEVADFTQFYQWYLAEFDHFFKLAIDGYRILDRNYAGKWPSPFLSSTVKACLETGRDIAGGGPVYHNASINGTGMATAVDSLEAVRRLVFRNKAVSLETVAAAAAGNYEGHGILRRQLRSCPHYGNGNQETDSLMAALVTRFAALAKESTNAFGGQFYAGMYTVEWHSVLGRMTGATPDGRKAGTALSNGMSPSQGADVEGPTAVALSATCFDHSCLGNGMVLDLKFHPEFLEKERHKEAFLHFVETYFALGGMELQVNVVSSKMLRQAQASPQNYRNLIARVSGFSAYFVDLDKTLQDEIIARTEYTGF